MGFGGKGTIGTIGSTAATGFTLGGPIGLGIGAVAGGLLSLFGGNEEEENQMERIRQIQKMLEEAKITDIDKNNEMDKISDSFNTSIIEGLNNNAVGLALGGVLNPGVVQAASMGKMLGQRENAITEYSTKVTDFNKNIDLKKAEVETQFVPSNDLDNFLTGAIGGLQTGMTVMDTFDAMKQRDELNEILKKFNW